MKKAVSAMLFALLSSMVFAANWVNTNGGSPYYFYDKSSIKTGKDKDDSLFIEVWIAMNIEDGDDSLHIKEKLYIACKSHRYVARARTIVYNKDGIPVKETGIKSIDELEWEETIPDSNDDLLAKEMCRLAYNKHMRPQKQTLPAIQYEKGVLNL